MRGILRFAFGLILLYPFQNAASPASPASLFEEANARYQKSEFDSAERYYCQLLSAGIDSGSVYYNLGNACFKQKKLGEAIYYWEKAREKLPGDPEVRENLELASLMIVDRIEVPPDPLPVRLLERGVHLLTINEGSALVLMLFVATNALFALYLLARHLRLASVALIGSVALGSLTLLFACALAWNIYEKGHRQQGIIISQKVEIHSGPGPENITVVTVHEGMKVRVRGKANGWYQVSLPNGWNGWLRQDSMRIL